jgi:hypothetical protein
LFQTYIEIFNKIEDVNLAALVVSSITIVALAINEILKVSTGQLSLFLCHHVHICVQWPICVSFSEAYFVHTHVCMCVCACVCARVRACTEFHKSSKFSNISST